MYKYGASKVRGGAPDVWILITTHHATAVFTLGRGDILESRTIVLRRRFRCLLGCILSFYPCSSQLTCLVVYLSICLLTINLCQYITAWLASRYALIATHFIPFPCIHPVPVQQQHTFTFSISKPFYTYIRW